MRVGAVASKKSLAKRFAALHRPKQTKNAHDNRGTNVRAVAVAENFSVFQKCIGGPDVVVPILIGWDGVIARRTSSDIRVRRCQKEVLMIRKARARFTRQASNERACGTCS